MRIRELANSVHHILRFHGFVGPHHTKMSKENGQYVVKFSKITTKTRASSIVTRMGLIVREMCPTAEVGKTLLGEKPKKRESLTLWEFYARIPGMVEKAKSKMAGR